MAEFSDEELKHINDTARRYQTDIDRAEVAELVNSPEFDPIDFQLQAFQNPALAGKAPPELWAATIVKMLRNAEREKAVGKEEKTKKIAVVQYITASGAEAAAGLQIIKDLGEFWRFKPTIEAIFDLESQQLEAADSYMKSFQGSDHENVLNRNKENLVDKYKRWDEEDLSTESINLGRSIYEECAKIFERGFPNLLALKRVLDGGEPDLEELQRIRASKVRRELTNVEGEEYSVYFDLIVDRYESDIRNGIAHNDIITDPGESVVRIPLTNSEYGYEEFNRIVRENIANAMFLTGAFQSLVEWHAATAGSEFREERPEWVFGDQSFYAELEDEVDDLEFDSDSLPI